jgi:hypothetical protein
MVALADHGLKGVHSGGGLDRLERELRAELSAWS